MSPSDEIDIEPPCICAAQSLPARGLRELCHLGGDCRNALAIRVADRRHDPSARGVSSEAHVKRAIKKDR